MSDLASPPLVNAALAAGVGAAASIALTLLMRRVAPRLGAEARPKDDRWHRQPVPLLGGVAVALATVTAATAVGGVDQVTVLVLAAGLTMFIVGLVDDFLPLNPATKLMAQIGMACLLVLLGGRLEWLESETANMLVTILWVVGITNAFNLLDNMDGLCAGVAAIAALSLAVLGGVEGASFAVYAAAMAGAAIGFLVFNFNPATIFLGDSGSLFIGASLAALTLHGAHASERGLIATLAVPVLVLLIPIFDTIFVTLSRKLASRAASRGGRDHTSHRLVAIGFSERQAVFLLYGLAALGGITALGLDLTSVTEMWLVLPLLLLALVLLGVYLARVRVYGDEDFSAIRNKPFTPLLVDITYRRRIFEVLLDLGLITFAYYGAYLIRFDREFALHYPFFVQSLPVIIACQLSSFFVVGVYRGVWRYFSAPDVTTYLKGVALGSVSSILALLYLFRFEGYSRGVFIINGMALALLLIGSRAFFRILGEWAGSYRLEGQPCVIYGAGDGGALLVRELRNNRRYGFTPVGFVDDDPRMWGKRVLGLRVFGPGGDLPAILTEHRVHAVVLSTAKLPATRLADVRGMCSAWGTRLLQLDFRLGVLEPGQHVTPHGVPPA